MGLDTLGLQFREIRLESPYPGGHVFFTLDGSEPTLVSTRYQQPFWVNVGTVLRAVAYSADYSTGGAAMRAEFVALPTYSLKVDINGGGSVFGYQNDRFSSNTVIQLSASANPGWRFTGWSGDIESLSLNLNFVLKSDVSIQANFISDGPALTVRPLQGKYLLVQFPALSSNDYIIETSSDLRVWTRFDVFKNKAGIVDAIFAVESNVQPKFYRVVSQPRGSFPPY